MEFSPNFPPIFTNFHHFSPLFPKFLPILTHFPPNFPSNFHFISIRFSAVFAPFPQIFPQFFAQNIPKFGSEPQKVPFFPQFSPNSPKLQGKKIGPKGWLKNGWKLDRNGTKNGWKKGIFGECSQKSPFSLFSPQNCPNFCYFYPFFTQFPETVEGFGTENGGKYHFLMNDPKMPIFGGGFGAEFGWKSSENGDKMGWKTDFLVLGPKLLFFKWLLDQNGANLGGIGQILSRSSKMVIFYPKLSQIHLIFSSK